MYGWDLNRMLTSRPASFLAGTLLSPQASDLTGSFRLYKKNVLERCLKSLKSRGYVFQMEIFVRAKYFGYSREEVSSTFVDRFFGESKLGAGELLACIQGLADIFLNV